MSRSWRLGAIREEHARDVLRPPDEGAARRQPLRTGVAASDLATVKDFIRFYSAEERGLALMPNVQLLTPSTR